LAYGDASLVERSRAALEASAAALNADEEAIAKIALLRAQLPAMQPRSSQLLKYFFDPLKHPRWPAGDPDHHGGEFRPVGTSEAETAGPSGGHGHGDVPLLVAVDDDEEVPPLGGRRRPKDEEVEPARILPNAPWANPPPGVSAPGAASPDANVLDHDAPTSADNASSEPEDGPPADESEQRCQMRARLNAFVAENYDLFRRDPNEARRQFEALNNVSDSIRSLPEYQSFWQMPSSYEAARVSDNYEQFPDMEAFKTEFGRAPSGWQYHHIVNQNPDNQANGDVNWRLHTTENVVLIPTWWHYLTFGPYNKKFDGDRTVRQWQATQSYSEQWVYGTKLLWETE
jgi:hypothetical protein